MATVLSPRLLPSHIYARLFHLRRRRAHGLRKDFFQGVTERFFPRRTNSREIFTNLKLREKHLSTETLIGK